MSYVIENYSEAPVPSVKEAWEHLASIQDSITEKTKSISGSYPDEMYHMFVLLSTVLGKKWTDARFDADVSEDEGVIRYAGNDREEVSGDDSDDDGERGSANGTDFSSSRVLESDPGSTLNTSGKRAVTGESRSAKKKIVKIRGTIVPVTEWKGCNSKLGTFLRHAFYFECQLKIECNAQFTWKLTEEILKEAINRVNGALVASGGSAIIPCTVNFIIATAAGTVRSVWLAPRMFKVFEEENAEKPIRPTELPLYVPFDNIQLRASREKVHKYAIRSWIVTLAPVKESSTPKRQQQQKPDHTSDGGSFLGDMNNAEKQRLDLIASAHRESAERLATSLESAGGKNASAISKMGDNILGASTILANAMMLRGFAGQMNPEEMLKLARELGPAPPAAPEEIDVLGPSCGADQ
mmetsp:Transcript_18687/g.46937  ORF Transcript_18687/g.46937 Transcript_18687/m.46937 type:complete len:410 (+) Transcript_18687:85-1314(+)